MKKSKVKVVVYTISWNDQIMFSTSKQHAVDAINQALGFIGSSITVTSSVRSKKWYDDLPNWDGWNI